MQLLRQPNRIQQGELEQDTRKDLIGNCVHPKYVDTDATKQYRVEGSCKTIQLIGAYFAVTRWRSENQLLASLKIKRNWNLNGRYFVVVWLTKSTVAMLLLLLLCSGVGSWRGRRGLVHWLRLSAETSRRRKPKKKKGEERRGEARKEQTERKTRS